jgi:NAD(P)-dependent dehydrogenase (short-subunit alcohol dehydrogenase family)
MSTSSRKIYLITGVNSGLGKAFAEAALNAGHSVIGTVRSQQAKADFERSVPGRAHAVVLDVTDFGAVEPAIAAAMQKVGPVDVLINNAGYGHEGILEESPLDELIKQFNVNVFGAVAVIKAVLPVMRARRSGHIFNITSMAGLTTFPGVAYYSGSKFALESISATLAQEVKSFGVRVTAVAPGSFRTDWAGRSMIRSERAIADYNKVFDPVRRARVIKSGKQSGDPAKAAQVILDLVENDNPPVHLLLGKDAIQVVRDRLTELRNEISAWEAVSTSTDYT